MVVPAQDLRQLDWSNLIAESESPSCDHLHRTLNRWLADGSPSITATNKTVWSAVEPILGLFLVPDADSDHRFLPSERVDAVETELLAELSGLVEQIPSFDLRARVWDLAWSRRACDHSRVPMAIDAYVASANERFDPQNWLFTFSRLQRALHVAASFGRRRPVFTGAVSAIEAAIDRAGQDDPLYLTLRLMAQLQRFQAGNAEEFAAFSHEMALKSRRAYEERGIGNGLECDREREFLEIEIRWRRQLKQDALARVAGLEVAEAFVRKAEAVIAAQWPAARTLAAGFIGNAIQQFRQLGGEDERVNALRLRQQVLQRESMAEMASVETTLDLAEEARDIRSRVAGKPPMLALKTLAFLHASPTVAELENEVRRQAQAFTVLSLLPKSYPGPRGTVLLEHSGSSDPGETLGFEASTMRLACELQEQVATLLQFAAQQIWDDYALDTGWFSGLCLRSTFVPANREGSFGRGLAAGLRGDYDLAALILCPQFEHAVRELFFDRGIVTTTLPSGGFQNEHNLNQLLENAGARAVFGDDLTFDLRVLLTEKAGSNLRNHLLHGILDDHDSRGAKIYFWWVCLKFVMLPFLNAVPTPEADEAADPVADPHQEPRT